MGSKDQLLLRVFLLRNGKKAAVTAREEEQLKDLVKLTTIVMFEQRTLSLTSHVYRKRSYTTGQKIPHFVAMPSHVNTENDLQHLFNPLLEHLRETKIRRETEDMNTVLNYTAQTPEVPSEEQFTQVGAKVKIKWDESEIADTR